MKRIVCVTAAAALMLSVAGAAAAQPGYTDRDHRGDHAQPQRDDHRGGYDNRDNHSRYVHHSEWRKGHRMSQNDWRRGQRVDYRAHHLRAPLRGYEWREVDGNYVMAAIATGLIASIIANAH